MGLHITESKACLETALDLSRDMYKNMSYINMSIDSINKELDNQKNMPDLPVNAIYVRVSMWLIYKYINLNFMIFYKNE